MSEPVKLITQTPLGNLVEIRLKTIFGTREFWVGLSSWVLMISPIAVNQLGQLGLSPWAMLFWSVGLATLNFIATLILKRISKSIVVSGASLKSEQKGMIDGN